MLLPVDNLVESVSPPTILTVLFSFTAAEPVSPVYTIPSFKVATVWSPIVILSAAVPVTSLALPALIVTGEPSAVFKVIDPLEPSIATEDPSAPFTVMELSVPAVPAVLSAALPKVILSASLRS